MTSHVTYICDGCGKQEPGVPTAGQPHELRDGVDALPGGWGDLRLQDFGTPLKAYFRHYCSNCTPRILAIINGPLV